jgi:secreted PhoX family phosphatase
VAATRVISTVAGGVGGPGKATAVGLPAACGVSFAGGALYIADGGTVQQVSPATDQLTTPAGTGAFGPPGNGGPATSASVGTCAATADATGNLVITDGENNAEGSPNDEVRVVAKNSGTFYGQAMTAGDIYMVAGNGTAGFAGDGGPATSAELNGPDGVVVDGSGNLVFADSGNSRVRVVAEGTGTFYGRAMTAGDIYTVAGNGTAGFAGDGGPATGAELSFPDDVALDAAGNLVITDSGNRRIRVVSERTGTFYGRAMTAGDIYTVAGNGTAGFAGDGGPATSAKLRDPAGVAVDGAGNLVIADSGNSRVRVVAEGTGTFYGQAMTVGDIYTVAGNGHFGYSGDHGPAANAVLNQPEGVAVDGAGNLVIADTLNDRVRVIAAATGTFYTQQMTAGDIYTVAGNGTFSFSGDGGPAAQAQLYIPEGVAVDGAGNWIIADGGNSRVRVVAESTGTFYGQAMTAGDIYTVAGNGKTGFGGDGGPATSAEVSFAESVVVDAAGNLVIADTFDARVRVVAVATGTFYGKKMTAGDIYTVAGNGKTGFSGDGGPATGAKVNFPQGVALDPAGNLVICDSDNNRIRVVAEHTGTFYGQAMTAGDIYTVAGSGGFGFSGDGGPATSAKFKNPAVVVADGAGNLVITDTFNNRVRVVAEHTGTFYGQAMTAGDIYTIAGNGHLGYSGDGGPAASATLADPTAVALDAAGNLVINDSGNGRVRVVATVTGTFYGKKMTAGDIYTVAGNGKTGFSGDGGPPTGAEFNFAPPGVQVLGGIGDVAVDGGNLLINDTGNNRLRLVTG